MKIKATIIIVLALVCVAGAVFLLRPAKESQEMENAAEIAVAPPASMPAWNTYHGDAQLTGYSPVNLPDALAVQWRYKAGAPVRQTPVTENGRIYFATARGEVVAIDFSGRRLWSKELFSDEKQKNGEPVRARIESPPACFASRVYIGTTRGALHALDAESGNELWTCMIDSPINGTVNCLPGRAYVISRADAVLVCIDAASGNILWRGDAIDRCDGSPAVSADAVAYGSCAAALHIFSPDTGKMTRNVAIGEDSQIAGGVAISDGDIYAGCRSGKIVRVESATGKIVWTNSDSETEVVSTPAVAGEWVVMSSNDGIMYGIDRATGKTKWKVETDASLSSPAIAGDKVLISADGELRMYRLADGGHLSSAKISDEITSPALAGTMALVGSEDGTVVALGPALAEEKGASGSE